MSCKAPPTVSSWVTSHVGAHSSDVTGGHYLEISARGSLEKGQGPEVMEKLYSTLLPHGRVHCMTWSGTNLVAVSLSEELPDTITEHNERCVCVCVRPTGVLVKLLLCR